MEKLIEKLSRNERLLVSFIFGAGVGILLYIVSAVAVLNLYKINLNEEDFGIFVLILQTCVIWYTFHAVVFNEDLV